MEVGILSKFKINGGSEFRCMELASGMARAGHHVRLYSEQTLSRELKNKLDDRVTVLNFRNEPETLYDLDALLTINTDSKSFTTSEFWEEFCDPCKIKRMIFLFNFIVSPSRFLNQDKDSLCSKCKDIRLITTNLRFYNELSYKEKLDAVKHLPKMVLESPIDKASVYQDKHNGPCIVIGQHSKGMGSKWNSDYYELVNTLNRSDIHDKIMWDLLGVNQQVAYELSEFDNVITRKEFSISVPNFLFGIDIYLFFIDYSRQEPWSRCVAEAMMSGCPIVATDVDGGNRMQVIHNNNGFLCKNVNDFATCIYKLVKDQELRKQMRKNSMIYSKEFETENIINKLLRFISD